MTLKDQGHASSLYSSSNSDGGCRDDRLALLRGGCRDSAASAFRPRLRWSELSSSRRDVMRLGRFQIDGDARSGFSRPDLRDESRLDSDLLPEPSRTSRSSAVLVRMLKFRLSASRRPPVIRDRFSGGDGLPCGVDLDCGGLMPETAGSAFSSWLELDVGSEDGRRRPALLESGGSWRPTPPL
jgi:hypothetical protein